MENIKGAPIEYKRPEPPTATASFPSGVALGSSLLSAGKSVVLCRRVATLRPELLLNSELCGLAPLVYRDTGELAEVGFGRHAELRLPINLPTREATAQVKHFSSRALRPTTLIAVTPGDNAELSVLARHWQPRVHAAFAFAPSEQHERKLAALWEPFGGAYAVVPLVSYVQVCGSSYVCHLVTATDGDRLLEPNDVNIALKQALEHLEVADKLLEHQSAGRGEPTSSPPVKRRPSAELDSDRLAWNERVSQALGAIMRGEFEKVVPARFAELAEPASLVSTMYALGNTHPDSTKFAFLGQSAAFVGATPEHLISKQGSTLKTEALAGTTASANGASQAFTEKEYHEHMPVLDAILSALAPLCSQLTHEVTPVPLRLPHVLHLRTAISGSLVDEATHVLDLVNALHPTPAVAGAPRASALAWLSMNEDFERGWYAGPVGWFDANGNGEFDVALRCGVLTKDRAVLFAGAGIVRGSVPDNEYEETVLKLRAMQTALSARAPDVHHEDHRL